MLEQLNSSQINRPLVSIVIPAYNEEAIVTKNMKLIYDYINEFESRYSWEIIFVNDGSTDKTGVLAEEFANNNNMVKVFHHLVNLNLGTALKTGFAHAAGEYIITLDLDLSYDTSHIGRILNTLEITQADVVIASPYMKGGKVTAVPFVRRILSRWVNRFMRIAAQEKFHTYTSLMRGYTTEFLKRLNLKAKDYEISPEILYKAMILRASIIEVPGHLDWTAQNKSKEKRSSGIRVLKTFFSGLMAGFIFRPYIFFLGLGMILLFLSSYVIGWIFINTFHIMSTIQIDPQIFDDKFSQAIGQVYRARPHAFIVGGITLLAAIQVLSLGFISLQNKRYFEESFHISSSILKRGK